MNCVYNILTIDDDSTILDAYASILVPYKNSSLEDAVLQLEQLHNMDQSDIAPVDMYVKFNVFQANNGLNGVNIFLEKYNDGITIPVCIVDMRMPNGIDGIETSLRLKQIDPDVHIIIATAYSDRTTKEILDALKTNIYYIRKPFNNEEIYQLVYSLSNSYFTIKTIRQLNNNLEIKINNEIEKNRQKDLLLFEQSKFSALGEMIGNIAHQWRQPLNIVSMLFQKIERSHKNNTLNDENMNKLVTQALDTVDYMSQTIDNFRSQFEPNREKEKYNLSSTIANTVALVDNSFNILGITIEIDILASIDLYGFPQDLKQILLNLLNNAKDAITLNSISSGKILIKAEYTDNQEKILIKVEDNGGGINKDYIDKIFEPYFTTKHKSQGTGIGLYMSKQIVEKHLGGTITVSSSNTNTCFNIIFPLSKKDN